MDIHALRQLDIIERDRIVPFEWPDPDSQFTDDNSKLFHHPLLVTPIDENSVLLLTDSELFYGMGESGLEFFPVQVCPSKEITVESETLGLVRFSRAELQRAVAKMPDRVILTEADSDRPGDDFRPVTFSFIDGTRCLAHIRHSSRAGCPPPLEEIFHAISRDGAWFPLPGSQLNDSLWNDYPHMTAIMSLPPVSLDDLLSAVAATRLFPPGAIGIRTVSRILNIDFPLSVLTDNCPIEDKRAFLHDLISLRVRRRRLSLHHGRVYLLNR